MSFFLYFQKSISDEIPTCSFFYIRGFRRALQCRKSSIHGLRWRRMCGEVYRVDDARDGIFVSAEDGELDGEDAVVEATVTVGVGEGIPCGEDVGGVR